MGKINIIYTKKIIEIEILQEKNLKKIFIFLHIQQIANQRFY